MLDLLYNLYLIPYLYTYRHPKGSEERLRAYQTATQTLGSACYIEGAMSSMLFLAYEFAEDFRGGVLSNANCGG
jgi:hypothetical protein